MFQLVDALEKMERDFSKKLLLKLKNLLSQKDYIVISFPIESLSGKTKFIIQRKWLVKFIIEEFNLITDFKLFGERILIFKNKD